MCIVLYSDRVNTWHAMQRINAVLDEQPTPDNCHQLIQQHIRNRQASAELQQYNTTTQFIYEHPLLHKRKAIAQLRELKRNNPAAFMQRFKTNERNIRHYKTLLKTKKYKNEAERIKYNECLTSYIEENNLLTTMLNE